MIVAEITKDHFDPQNDPNMQSRKGDNWTLDDVLDSLNRDWYIDEELEEIAQNFKQSPKTRFRLCDDDGVLCYSGWLINDDWCYMQSILLSWAERDVGATNIKILDKNNEWVWEIG